MEYLFNERNQAVMLAVKFACILGLNTGLGEDPLDLGWPVLYIDLPDGSQVCWRIPPEDLVGTYPSYQGRWDSQNPDERGKRLQRYLTSNMPASSSEPEVSPQASSNHSQNVSQLSDLMVIMLLA